MGKELPEVDDCVLLYADSSLTFLSSAAETAMLTNADKNFFVMVFIFLLIKVRQTNVTWWWLAPECCKHLLQAVKWTSILYLFNILQFNKCLCYIWLLFYITHLADKHSTYLILSFFIFSLCCICLEDITTDLSENIE